MQFLSQRSAFVGQPGLSKQGAFPKTTLTASVGLVATNEPVGRSPEVSSQR